MCQILNVSRSGYYAWRNRPPSQQARQQATLVEQIRSAHATSRQTYGAPRVHAELKAQGVACSKNTVAKLMRRERIRSKRSRKFVVRTTDSRHPHPIAPNRLNREFKRSSPNEAWVCDITYIPTEEGWVYLAAVLDLCSRRVVGWSVEDHLRAELPRQALEMAVNSRQPQGPVLHHSDRGVQYACEDYQAMLQKHGLVGSMSRTGNCYDNAVMESFFGSLKTELVHHARFETKSEARKALFEYVELFYNRVRRHSALGYRSPADFEQSLN
jgi:transposase InsO family protein